MHSVSVTRPQQLAAHESCLGFRGEVQNASSSQEHPLIPLTSAPQSPMNHLIILEVAVRYDRSSVGSCVVNPVTTTYAVTLAPSSAKAATTVSALLRFVWGGYTHSTMDLMCLCWRLGVTQMDIRSFSSCWVQELFPLMIFSSRDEINISRKSPMNFVEREI